MSITVASHWSTSIITCKEVGVSSFSNGDMCYDSLYFKFDTIEKISHQHLIFEIIKSVYIQDTCDIIVHATLQENIYIYIFRYCQKAYPIFIILTKISFSQIELTKNKKYIFFPYGKQQISYFKIIIILKIYLLTY